MSILKLVFVADGQQLRITKDDIQDLQTLLAEKAHEQGIELDASPRWARGLEGEERISVTDLANAFPGDAQEGPDLLERALLAGGGRQRVHQPCQKPMVSKHSLAETEIPATCDPTSGQVGGAGLHTVTWNLRGAAPEAEPLSPSERRDSIAVAKRARFVADSLVEAGPWRGEYFKFASFCRRLVLV